MKRARSNRQPFRRSRQPGAADFGRWRKVIRLARAACAKPAGPMGDLQAALRSAGHAVLPVGEQNLQSRSWAFYKAALAFTNAEPDARRRDAGGLASLADECSAALGFDAPASPQPLAGEPDAAPARRYRADIDG